MKNFLEGLKSYLEKNSREQILKDWEEATKKFESVGPTIEEFFEECKPYPQHEYLNEIKSPNYSSGFFIFAN